MYLKTKTDISAILEGGAILGEILEYLGTLVKPGVTGLDIDTEAEARIRAAGGVPAFKGYGEGGNGPFPGTICFSINDEVVHGIPTAKKVIKAGDVVKVDIGMEYGSRSGKDKGRGYFTDTAITVIAGKADEPTKQLLVDTYDSLMLGIAAAQSGNTILDISTAIEGYLKPKKYGIVRDLVGHGVGYEVHEDPRVPNYIDKTLGSWKLEPGLVIAIEPMVTMGDWRVRLAKDGWGIVTKDGSMSAQFEHTVVITKDGPVIATKRPSEK